MTMTMARFPLWEPGHSHSRVSHALSALTLCRYAFFA